MKNSEKPRIKRNDSISPVAIVVLVVFWLLQSTLLQNVPGFHSRRGILARFNNSSAKSPLDYPDDLVQQITSIDVVYKWQYGMDALKEMASSSHAAEQTALPKQRAVKKSARTDPAGLITALFIKYPNIPTVARRLILIRAEEHLGDPLAPVGKNLYPLDAFNAPSDASKQTAGLYNNERSTWQELFSTAIISKSQQVELVTRINSFPNLRWWKWIALQQLYQKSGEKSLQDQAIKHRNQDALESVLSTTLVTMTMFGAGMIGIGLLLYLFTAKPWLDQSAPALFHPLPQNISNDERRLGVGDLLNLFIAYIILYEGISIALPYLLHGEIEKAINNLSYSHRFEFLLVIQIAAMCLSGGSIIFAGQWIAKNRGSSLATEIGLKIDWRRFGQLTLFGLIGWSISLPILFLVAFGTKLVFRHAPAPANAVIPLMMSTPNAITALLIYVTVSICAPFFEETMFRGFFFNATRLKFGPIVGIGLTGLVFGLAHQVGVADQITLMTLGMTLAWIAETSKSLYPGMIVHCLQNSTVYAITYFSLLTIAS